MSTFAVLKIIMSNNVYEFRKKTKPLRKGKYSIYLRDVDVNTGDVIGDKERDIIFKSRCVSLKYIRDSIKSRIELVFKEGTDLKTLESCMKLNTTCLVSIDTIDDNNRVKSSIHLLCVLDSQEQDFNRSDHDGIIKTSVILIIKKRILDINLVYKNNSTNETPSQEDE